MVEQVKSFVVYKGIIEDRSKDRPIRKQIEVVPFDPGLKYLQNLVGGYLEHYIIDEGLNELYIDMWIDEEGKLKDGLIPTFALCHDGQLIDVIFGNCVFSKYNREGETLGLNEDEVVTVLKYLEDLPIVGLLKKDGSTDPCLAVDR